MFDVIAVVTIADPVTVADISRKPDRDEVTVTVAALPLVRPVTVTTSDERVTEPDDVVTLTVWEVNEFKLVMLNVNPSDVEVVAPSVGTTELGKLVTRAVADEDSTAKPPEFVARTSNLMYMSTSSSESTYVNPVAPLIGMYVPDGLEARIQRYV